MTEGIFQFPSKTAADYYREMELALQETEQDTTV